VPENGACGRYYSTEPYIKSKTDLEEVRNIYGYLD
jgi:hypothetical protein